MAYAFYPGFVPTKLIPTRARLVAVSVLGACTVLICGFSLSLPSWMAYRARQGNDDSFKAAKADVIKFFRPNADAITAAIDARSLCSVSDNPEKRFSVCLDPSDYTGDFTNYYTSSRRWVRNVDGGSATLNYEAYAHHRLPDPTQSGYTLSASFTALPETPMSDFDRAGRAFAARLFGEALGDKERAEKTIANCLAFSDKTFPEKVGDTEINCRYMPNVKLGKMVPYQNVLTITVTSPTGSVLNAANL